MGAEEALPGGGTAGEEGTGAPAVPGKLADVTTAPDPYSPSQPAREAGSPPDPHLGLGLQFSPACNVSTACLRCGRGSVWQVATLSSADMPGPGQPPPPLPCSPADLLLFATPALG